MVRRAPVGSWELMKRTGAGAGNVDRQITAAAGVADCTGEEWRSACRRKVVCVVGSGRAGGFGKLGQLVGDRRVAAGF